MGVPTHWSGAVNSGTGVDRGIYFLSPKNVRAIHCDQSYHGLVFSVGADARNALIQEIVGTARPGYHEDQGGESSRRGRGGYGGEELELKGEGE